MSTPLIGSEEIDRTLRLERDAVERQIARFRVWFFITVFCSGPFFALVGRLTGAAKMSPVPGLVLYGVCVAYALLLRRDVDRHGVRTWLVYTALVLDLLAITAPGVVFPMFDPEIARTKVLFGSHLCAPGLLMVLMVNSLRMRERSALFGAIVATMLCAALLISIEGVQPPLVGLLLGILFTGPLGMAAARRARHSLDTFARLQLLQRYLPPAAVERVLRDAPDSALSLGGRLCTVTLLSSDLRGFTRMSENLAPEEVVKQLNDFHARMVEAVEKHGGAVDKFIGDGMLAVFGMQPGNAAPPDAGAGDAVACAEAMLKAIDALNHERQSAGLAPLAMGIGVHTGQVIAGNIGAPGKRLEFTVIGDAVNTASRLEGLTKEAGRPLLVSGETAKRVARAARFEALPPMAVRGREAALEIFGVKAA